MRKRHSGKAFNTIFTMTFIGFIIFLYLFATRVTPWDIDYFIVDTKTKTQKVVTFVNDKRTEFISSKKSIALGGTDKKKDTLPKADTVSENVKTTDEDSVNEDGETILKSDSLNIVYYCQSDPRWKGEIYGTDNTIGEYGCGPTALAMVLSTLTDDTVTPVDAAKWAFDNGHFSNNSGSYHSIIPKGAEKHGLNCESLKSPTKQTIIDELSKGHIIVVLMSTGTFATEGHFLVLRGITDDSKILIADPKSLENSEVPWDLDIILNEAKYSASYGGPFWSISKP